MYKETEAQTVLKYVLAYGSDTRDKGFSNLCFKFLSIVPLTSECLLGNLGFPGSASAAEGVGGKRKNDEKGFSQPVFNLNIFALIWFRNREASIFVHNSFLKPSGCLKRRLTCWKMDSILF